MGACPPPSRWSACGWKSAECCGSPTPSGVGDPIGARPGSVARYGPRRRYVGGHPMAGTAESGWAAGSAGLFAGAAWVVGSDDGVDRGVWADVAELAWACDAHVVPAAADEHDLAVA